MTRVSQLIVNSACGVHDRRWISGEERWINIDNIDPVGQIESVVCIEISRGLFRLIIMMMFD